MSTASSALVRLSLRDLAYLEEALRFLARGKRCIRHNCGKACLCPHCCARRVQANMTVERPPLFPRE